MPNKTNKVPPRKSGAGRSGRPPVPPRNRRTKRNRGRPSRVYLYVGLAVVIVGAVVGIVVGLSGGGGSSGPTLENQPAIGYTLPNGTKVYGALGPEHVPLELGPQLAAPNTGLTGAVIDGVQCGSTEQLAYHHHIHLAIFADGKPYSVPIGVGMVPPIQVENTSSGPFAEGSSTCLYWLHVHAQDGVVHIESPVARNFVLGQVMDIWHVPLTPGQVGPYKGHVTVTVNGSRYTGDPREIPLTEHAQIVVNVGTPVISPPPIVWNGTSL